MLKRLHWFFADFSLLTLVLFGPASIFYSLRELVFHASGWAPSYTTEVISLFYIPALFIFLVLNNIFFSKEASLVKFLRAGLMFSSSFALIDFFISFADGNTGEGIDWLFVLIIFCVDLGLLLTTTTMFLTSTKYEVNFKEEERRKLKILIAVGAFFVMFVWSATSFFLELPHNIERYGRSRMSAAPTVPQARYVYWVHLAGVFENGCCEQQNPSPPIDPTLRPYQVFDLKGAPDPRGYEGVVCLGDCAKNVVWHGPVTFGLSASGKYELRLYANGQHKP